MQSQLITTAISLLCAWSQPHCDKAQQNKIEYGQVDPHGMSWYNSRKHVISISSDNKQPEVIAALLAHETTNAMGDWSKGLTFCVDNETSAYQAEASQYSWFVNTFGPIDPATLSTSETYYVATIPDKGFAARSWATFACRFAKSL